MGGRAVEAAPPQSSGAAGSSVDVGLAFRTAMSHLAAGVVMVTSRIDGRPWGLTISACCSVSLRPPMLLISLGSHTASASSIDTDRVFGVTILGERMLEVAEFGAAPGSPKFVEAFCDVERAGREALRTPLVAGGLAHVECDVVNTVVAGDHTLFIGQVASVVLSGSDAPLLYYSRGYRRISTYSQADLFPLL
jgi:flavin reductase ActVB